MVDKLKKHILKMFRVYGWHSAFVCFTEIYLGDDFSGL